jgi:hypothetical protein
MVDPYLVRSGFLFTYRVTSIVANHEIHQCILSLELRAHWTTRRGSGLTAHKNTQSRLRYPCIPTRPFHAQLRYPVKSHANGRSAHHSGCSDIACTPRFLKRYPSSCRRGSAALRLPPGPLQNTSADAAVRGHTIESRFCGPDCSVQSSCCPPSTSGTCVADRFASGSKV